MKNTLSYVLSGFKRKFVAAALIAVAVAVPISTVSAAAVQIEGSMGVANVTAGDTLYKTAVNASFDQVVKFQVYYHNKELPDSGKVAEDLRVKITMPAAAGATQNVRATIAGTNTNVIDSVATVNINRNDANLSYIPGSAVWKHNKGTNDNPQIVEEKISDAVVTSGQGLVLEDEKPCYNFDATVTVLARVTVPSVQIDKYVRVKGQTDWVRSNTAKPGETLEYQIAYKNVGNTTQNKVVIRDNLPPKLAYIAGTTYLKNGANPSGVKYASDNIATGGIVVGDYAPGGAAYVKFDVKIPEAKDLACGKTEFRNVGVARPEGMNEFYNTAITTVNRECVEPEKPVYSCDALKVAVIGERKISATLTYTAKNGATFNNATYSFGDNSQNLVTKDTTVEHTYDKYGTYTVKVVPTFMVDGKVVTAADNAACTQKVTLDDKPLKPVYSCDMLNLEVIGTRKIKATVAYTAQNGATLNNIGYDFGDGSAKLVTKETTTEHTYAADGTYTVRATVNFNVDGKVVPVDSSACAKVVTFEKGEEVTPVPPTATPSTGPAETIGLFIGASAISAIGYRFWMVRRFGN